VRGCNKVERARGINRLKKQRWKRLRAVSVCSGHVVVGGCGEKQEITLAIEERTNPKKGG